MRSDCSLFFSFFIFSFILFFFDSSYFFFLLFNATLSFLSSAGQTAGGGEKWRERERESGNKLGNPVKPSKTQ